jgi:hypothetical protein
MAHLSLDAEAAATLAQALRSYLSDLHTEISHTDAEGFRDELKRRREVLNGIVEQLEQEAPRDTPGILSS